MLGQRIVLPRPGLPKMFDLLLCGFLGRVYGVRLVHTVRSEEQDDLVEVAWLTCFLYVVDSVFVQVNVFIFGLGMALRIRYSIQFLGTVCRTVWPRCGDNSISWYGLFMARTKMATDRDMMRTYDDDDDDDDGVMMMV